MNEHISLKLTREEIFMSKGLNFDMLLILYAVNLVMIVVVLAAAEAT